MSLDIKSTALDHREEEKKTEPKQESPKKEEKIKKQIKQFGEVQNLNKKIIDRIDFSDKRFINRIYDDKNEILKDPDFKELIESIKNIGLINIIYLLKSKTDEKKLILVSGLRRSLAVREILKQEKQNFPERVVIFDEGTPVKILDELSVDENIQRKDLTVLEKSYKFNKEAKKKGKKISDILEEYNISKKHFYRIKNAMDYPKELKDILEEVGPRRAAIINRIIKAKNGKEKVQDIVDFCKNLSNDELNKLLRKARKKKKKKIEYKAKKTQVEIKINMPENQEILKAFEEFKKKIEEIS
ncbi:MAG: ParB N-terminal domain-containing protein [Fusobacteriota bacterium]